MTLKNDRAPLLYYVKLCASFQRHWWTQAGVTVRKCSIWVKFGDFLPRVTLKYYRWLWKTIGHHFYATSSSVHHFKAINEFKLDLQSGNARSGSKSAIFLSRVTLKSERWPWKTIGHLFYATSSFVDHVIAIQKFKQELQSRNDQLGWKIDDFVSRVTLNFDRRPWKTIAHLFPATSNFLHHFIVIGELQLQF